MWLAVHHLVRSSYSKHKKEEFVRQLDEFDSPYLQSTSSMRLWRDMFNWPGTIKKGDTWIQCLDFERKGVSVCLSIFTELKLADSAFKTGPKQHMFTSCFLTNVILFWILPSSCFQSFYFPKEERKLFKYYKTKGIFLTPCFLIFIKLFF